MKAEFIPHEHVLSAIKKRQAFLDVRAPIEFAEGSLPGAVNLPILNNQERHQIGAEYKSSGPAAAIALGEKLISGSVRDERVRSWVGFYSSNTKAPLYCFRGGQRSLYAQNWLRDAGYNVQRVEGGYKRYRQLLIETLCTLPSQLDYTIVSGKTGSGKTKLIQSLSPNIAKVDIEHLANHRGSAFGHTFTAQPSQVDFENKLSAELMIQADISKHILLEDESRTVGAVTLPNLFFEKMNTSPTVVIDDPIPVRARRIYDEYVEFTYNHLTPSDNAKNILFERLRLSLLRIQKRLGGLRWGIAQDLLEKAFSSTDMVLNFDIHVEWITYLLSNYYDPLYENGILKRSPKILFRGSWVEVREKLEHN